MLDVTLRAQDVICWRPREPQHAVAGLGDGFYRPGAVRVVAADARGVGTAGAGVQVDVNRYVGEGVGAGRRQSSCASRIPPNTCCRPS